MEVQITAETFRGETVGTIIDPHIGGGKIMNPLNLALEAFKESRYMIDPTTIEIKRKK